MKEKEMYDNVFIESFSINKDHLDDNLEYNSVSSWDSVGHMALISTLEEKFNITMEMDDIIDFSSYRKGIEIIEKYGVKING